MLDGRVMISHFWGIDSGDTDGDIVTDDVGPSGDIGIESVAIVD
jgi:hypothetical protein